MRGAYTRGNNKISNFNVSCNVKLLQIIITAQQLMVSPDQSNIRFFSLKPLHSKEIFLSENFLLKTAFVKLATVTSSIKCLYIYRRGPNIGEKLKCVLQETNRPSNTAIKVAGDANETIGDIPDGLSKVVAPELKLNVTTVSLIKLIFCMKKKTQ